MYEYIQGKITTIANNYVVVDVGGIGYKVFSPANSLQYLEHRKGETLIFFLTFIVREDAQNLYGFLKKEERELFEMLLTISGIGPKIALCLMGHLDFSSILQAFAEGDVALLSKVPGIGKKTAERIVVEMKNKMNDGKKSFQIFFDDSLTSPNIKDAIQALIHLGYSPLKAQKAIKGIVEENKNEKLDTGSLVTLALKKN